MQFNISEEDRNKSGIYIIRNTVNKRVYVGSTVKFRLRYNQHKNTLAKTTHFNIKLTRFVNKYGIDKLIFEALEFCEGEEMILREQFWIDHYQCYYNNGFNIQPVVVRELITEETEKRIELHAIKTGVKKIYKCKICSTVFVRNNFHKSKGYCSVECSAKGKKSPLKNCQICGEPFESKAFAKRKYCSRACYLKTPKKVYPKKECLVCGVLFDPKYSRKEGTKLCSVKCTSVFKRSLTPWNKGKPLSKNAPIL